MRTRGRAASPSSPRASGASDSAADRDILGRTVNLSGRPYTIVGVAPSSLAYPGRSRLWLPFGFGLGRSNDRDSHSYDVIARLTPSATVATAQADMDAVARGR